MFLLYAYTNATKTAANHTGSSSSIVYSRDGSDYETEPIKFKTPRNVEATR